MNRILNRIRIILYLSFSILVCACDDDEPPLPANFAAFGASETGIEESDSETFVTVSTSRPVDADATIVVTLTPSGLAYGNEFTTNPGAVGNKITLTVPQGGNGATFTVVKTPGIFLEGIETIDFQIESVSDALAIGDHANLKLNFASIISKGSQLQLNGLIGGEPGSSAGNTVFVDFSSNVQTSVARNSWDLGFYTGDAFRVILNHANGASAIPVNKTDITQVTAADINIDDLAIGFAAGSFSAYDSVDGHLDHTAIDEVSASADDNTVWVVNRAGGAGTTEPVESLVKIKVVRKDNGYTLQYAKLNDATFQSVDIAKDAAYNFNYFNFDSGNVFVEPSKDRWDIQWTWGIFYTSSGGVNVPYAFSDLVFLNHHNAVSADTVFTSEISYTDFSEENLAQASLANDRNVIGSGWRATTGTVGVRTDRFYIIEDSYKNIYKLRFLSFHAADGGIRGKPVLEYALVKKGS